MSRNPQKHLTENEFIHFVLEELSEEETTALDQHLEYCVACTQQLEEFYTAQDAFPAETWAAQRPAFVATLRERLFGRPWWLEVVQTVRESVAARLCAGLAWAATDEAPQALGTIPAWIRRNEVTESVVLVTQKPIISRDGRLCLGIQVKPSDVRPGERFELVLLAIAPQEEPLGSPLTFDPREEQSLAFELSHTRQSKWAGMEAWDWAALPFRIFLRPVGTTESEDPDGAPLRD